MPFWTLEATTQSPKCKWTTGEAYDIKGNDHVVHVQSKIDESGLSGEYEIVLPKANELQIDYDIPELPERFHKVLDLLVQAFCRLHQTITYTIRKSRHENLHITIILPCAIMNTERIAWQAIFGSDHMREGLSMMSERRGIANPTLLIERRNSEPCAAGSMTLEPKTGRKFR
jgi:hypothetical protein